MTHPSIPRCPACASLDRADDMVTGESCHHPWHDGTHDPMVESLRNFACPTCGGRQVIPGRVADRWCRDRWHSDLHTFETGLAEAEASRQASRQASFRPTDAGTENEWTVVGDVKVYVWRHHLPVVLGRWEPQADPMVAIQVAASKDGSLVTLTAHQARALAEVLPAAAALADETQA